jgi:hypothetical protein
MKARSSWAKADNMMTDCRPRTASHEASYVTAGPIAGKLPKIRTQTEIIFSLGAHSDYDPKRIGFELSAASAKGRVIGQTAYRRAKLSVFATQPKPPFHGYARGGMLRGWLAVA